MNLDEQTPRGAQITTFRGGLLGYLDPCEFVRAEFNATGQRSRWQFESRNDEIGKARIDALCLWSTINIKMFVGMQGLRFLYF